MARNTLVHKSNPTTINDKSTLTSLDPHQPEAQSVTLSSGPAAEAVLFYERAADYARKAQAYLSEGAAYNALGSVYEQEGQLYQALHHKRTYRRISQRNCARDDECAASLSVASLEERLGLMHDASMSLSCALHLAA
uniref:Tetratricopeptide repeat protein 29 n=1 Tax=Lygus hesperus TaxID=30085 RepID=A0A0A9XZF8_LYGHE